VGPGGEIGPSRERSPEFAHAWGEFGEGGEVSGGGEAADVADLGDHEQGDEHTDAGDAEPRAPCLQRVSEPLPAERRLERDPRVLSHLKENRTKRLRVIRDPEREQLQAVLVEGSNVRAPAMKVDADIYRDGPFRSRLDCLGLTPRENGLSRRPASS
jgi:hypothetical protein